MQTLRRFFSAVISASLILLNLAAAGQAQDVMLKSRDGAIELSGTLLGFNGEFYRVETVYGELTVDGSGVTCDGPGCPSLTDYIAQVRLSGARELGLVLIPALLEAFAAQNHLLAVLEPIDDSRFTYVLKDQRSDKIQAEFHFQLSTAEEGFADLIADNAEISMSTREIRAAEKHRLEEGQPHDLPYRREHVLALDALVPVTIPDHPVRQISLKNLALVFGGKITNWRDLGGPNAPIALYLRSHASGTSQSVTDRILQPADQDITDAVTRIADGKDLDLRVSRDPLALALMTHSYIRFSHPMQISGDCGVSLGADPRMIKTQDYPITTPIFLYMAMHRLPKIAREFLAYTSTDSAQAVIERAGFINQNLEEIPLNQQGDRLVQAVSVAGTGSVEKAMDLDASKPSTQNTGATLKDLQNMLNFLAPLRRVTMSFRFLSGSSQLDAQSRANIHRLAMVLESGAYDGRQLAFVGFSDGLGPASRNLEIAQKRAETIRDAVLKIAEAVNLDRINITTTAFGEAMPMACDDTEWGRDVNRRVEIWVR
jgi:phosphate transport system substrate-binding protein